jgi:hypothetical protein
MGLKILIEKASGFKRMRSERSNPLKTSSLSMMKKVIYLLVSRQNLDGHWQLQLEEYTEVWSLGQGAFGLMKEIMWLTHNCALKITKLGGERKEVILKSYTYSQIVQFFLCWKDNVKKKTYIMMKKMEEDLNNMYVEKRFGELPQVNLGAMDLPMAIDIML